MTTTRILLCSAFLMAGSVAGPAEAWAKKTDQADKAKRKTADKARKRATRMEKAGKVHYKRGEYDDAIIAFEAAYEADPQPKFLYNIARCHEKKGDLAQAAHLYDRYLEEAPDAEDHDAVRTQAEFLTSKLEKTKAKLAVTSRPEGAGVHIEGKGQALDVKAPWSGWLDPGRYELSALLKGHDEYTERLALAAGEERKVQVDFIGGTKKAESGVAEGGEEKEKEPPVEVKPKPKEPKPEPAAVVASSPPPDADGGGGDGIGLAPIASFGLAAVGLISWGVFGGLSMSKAGELDEAEGGRRASGKTREEADDVADSANLLGVVADVSLAVAAAAGLTGGALILLDGSGEGATAAVRWTW